MTVTEIKLRELGFCLTHVCEKQGTDGARFVQAEGADRQTLDSAEPMVYVWLSPVADGFEAMYVGKAGRGITQRLRQHEGGFRSKGPGKKNLSKILDLFKVDRSLVVYARKSERVEILCVEGVNLYSVEEEAVCEILQPKWNRAKFATRRQNGRSNTPVETPPETTEQTGDDRNFAVGPVHFSDLPHAELLHDFMESIADQDKARVLKVLDWVQGLAATRRAKIKIVRGYTNQPQGYNAVATLLVAPEDRTGRARPNEWVMRLPLRSDEVYPLTVTLPLRTRATTVGDHEICQGRDTNFRPLDLDAFLANPAHFTTLN